ncbi:hypothetical protein D3C73_588000 [compost metagenome]
MQHGRHEMQRRHPACLNRLHDLFRVLLSSGNEEVYGGSRLRPPEQFPYRYVKGERRLLQYDVLRRKRIRLLHPRKPVDHRMMLDHDPFRVPR